MESGGASLDMEIESNPCRMVVAAEPEGINGEGASSVPCVGADIAADLMKRLKLTSEEATAIILEDENEDDLLSLEWAITGKVLSPTVLHIQTIMAALRPAWGNPKGMNPRSVGNNIFIVEFATKADKDRVEAGAPWSVGKHAVLINNFDAKQKPSEVCFDKLTLWARIKNPRFELMNKLWGETLGAKLGKVEKVEVDSQGRAWGDYLRIRVTVDITKPLLRWVTAYSKKHKQLETYKVVYERLPHYCFSCGLLGHSSMECPTPSERDEEGKLPWNADRLCVKDDRKRSFSASKSGHSSQSSGKNSDNQVPSKSRSNEKVSDVGEGQVEVNSPMQVKELNPKLKGKAEQDNVSTELLPAHTMLTQVIGQKRKQTKVLRPQGSVLNTNEIVPQDTNSLAIVIGGNSQKRNDLCPSLGQINDDMLNDSCKKMRKEPTTYVTGSAGQAEAAEMQPRHTQ